MKKQPGQTRMVIDKSAMGRTKQGGLTRADPQSKEPSSKPSGILDSGRGHTSRTMSTHRSVRSLSNVAPSRR